MYPLSCHVFSLLFILFFVWIISVWDTICINIAWFCRKNQLTISSLLMKASHVNLQHWWPAKRQWWLTRLIPPPPMPSPFLCLRLARCLCSIYAETSHLLDGRYILMVLKDGDSILPQEDYELPDKGRPCVRSSFLRSLPTGLCMARWTGRPDLVLQLEGIPAALLHPLPCQSHSKNSWSLSTITEGSGCKYCIAWIPGPRSLTSR